MTEALQNHSFLLSGELRDSGPPTCLVRDGASEERRKAEFWSTERKNVRVVPAGHLGFPHAGVSREVGASLE